MYAGTVLRVDGSLHDDLGAPLANRELTAYLEPLQGEGRALRRTLRSNGRGRFQFDAACETAACRVTRVTVEYEGDTYYERAALTQVVEVQRAELRLQWQEPNALAVSVDEPHLLLVLTASSPLGGAGLRVKIENELSQPVGEGTTDAGGKLELQIASTRLGAPGLGELIARSTGDAQRSAARSGKPILRTRATHTSLTAKLSQAAPRLELEVELKTRAGPVADRAVGVFAGDKHLVTLLTDSSGRAARALALAPLQLAEGQHQLRARFESDVPGVLSSQSPEVTLTIQPSTRPSAIWLVVPALASLLFALWSARRSAQVKPGQARSAPEAPEVQLGTPLRGRSAPMYSLQGFAEDVDSGEPLGAVLLVTGTQTPAQQQRVQANPLGQFASPALAPDTYRVSAHAPGYAPAEFSVAVPHHGTGSNIRISLRSLRVLALEAYAPVTQRVISSEQRRLTATARETLNAAVSGRRAGPTLEPLTDQVERIAYAAAIPHSSDLTRVQRAATQAIDEIALRSPAAEDPGLGR